MKAFCTYCSALKDPTLKMLPAINRYKSSRITMVYEKSQQAEVEFFILSGKFGLLHSTDKVPFYDHLLQRSEVEEHATIVADQIEKTGLNEIVFFVRPPHQDKNSGNYLDCLERACDKAGIVLEIKEYSEY